MRYAEYLPSPGLAGLVDRFWLLEGRGNGVADAVFPDGRLELIFHYGGTFWRQRDGLAPVAQPSALLVGQMMEPVLLAPDGHTGIAAIRLRPAAGRTLLGFALGEVAGQFVDLESIFPSAARLTEHLADASTDTARVSALERWLLEMSCPPPRRAVEAAVALILDTGGRIPVDALTSHTNLSVRQIERTFQDDVGLSPKSFARIIRLQSALRRIRAGHPLSAVAATCGYYDQAHMSRDFRQIASISPDSWKRHAGLLAPLFLT